MGEQGPLFSFHVSTHAAAAHTPSAGLLCPRGQRGAEPRIQGTASSPRLPVPKEHDASTSSRPPVALSSLAWSRVAERALSAQALPLRLQP